jgi:hypothetical protein
VRTPFFPSSLQKEGKHTWKPWHAAHPPPAVHAGPLRALLLNAPCRKHAQGGCHGRDAQLPRSCQRLRPPVPKPQLARASSTTTLSNDEASPSLRTPLPHTATQWR